MPSRPVRVEIGEITQEEADMILKQEEHTPDHHASKKLHPIISCKECSFLGKEVTAEKRQVTLGTVKKGSFKTTCNHPELKQPFTIYFGAKLEPERHYKIREFCPLKDEQ